MAKPTISLSLDLSEYALLIRQNPKTKGDGGFQSLLVKLQTKTDPDTLVMELPTVLVSRIRRYAFGYGNGGWENRLTGIFSRHLGPALDQIPE